MLTAVFGGGWWAALQLESPAQREAAATAPSPGPVVADVTEGVLAQTISARGTIQASTTVTRPLPAEAAVTVVTQRPVKTGARVESGRAFIMLNGKPVFTIAGVFPFYRDLGTDMAGPDVKQLQAGLGIARTGVFDSATEAAVAAMYRRAGAAAPATVPASDLVVVPGTVTLARAPAAGAVVSADTTVTFTSGTLVAAVDMSSGVAEGVTVGMPVKLTTAAGTADGSVTAVSTHQGEDTTTVVIEPAKAFAAAQSGDNVVAVLVLTEVAPAGLTVPSLAVVGSGALNAYVQKQQPDGSFVNVAVTETGTLDGMSAITVTGGDLAAGDRVRVG